MTSINVMPSQEVQASFGRFKMSEKGIIMLVMNQGIGFELKHVKEMQEHIRDLMPDKKSALFVDIRGMLYMSKDAREYAASDAYDDVRLATAVLVDSPVTLMIMNIYLKIRLQTTPFKLFSNKEMALAWLEQFV